MDDADSFVSQPNIGLDRNGTPHVVHVGGADHGRGGAHHRLIGSGLGDRLLDDIDLPICLNTNAFIVSVAILVSATSLSSFTGRLVSSVRLRAMRL